MKRGMNEKRELISSIEMRELDLQSSPCLQKLSNISGPSFLPSHVSHYSFPDLLVSLDSFQINLLSHSTFASIQSWDLHSFLSQHYFTSASHSPAPFFSIPLIGGWSLTQGFSHPLLPSPCVQHAGQNSAQCAGQCRGERVLSVGGSADVGDEKRRRSRERVFRMVEGWRRCIFRVIGRWGWR